MKEEADPKPEAPRSKKLLKRLGIASGAGVSLVIIAYLSVTSSAFVKSVVLPKVSAALNAEVTVTDASVGLFSGVSMKGLKVVSADTELVKAGGATLRCSFWNLVSGRIRVSELKLDSPEVYLVRYPDDTSNLTPVLEALESGEPAPEKPASAAPDLQLKNIDLKNAKIRYEQHLQAGGVRVLEAGPVSVQVDQVGNGIDGKLNLSTGVLIEEGPEVGKAVDALHADVSAEFTFGLDANFLPKGLAGMSSIKINKAEGVCSDAKDLFTRLKLSLDLTTIHELNLNLSRSGTTLSEIKMSGPFNSETLDADLEISVTGIDRNLLSFATGRLGLDVGETAINSTTSIQLRENAGRVNVKGTLDVAKLSVKKDTLQTPVVDSKLAYQLGVDVPGKSAALEILDLGITQTGRELVVATLSKPLSVAWGDEPGVKDDSELRFKVSNLNLADWAAVAGDYVSAGVANADWRIVAANDGADVSISGSEALQGLRVKIGETNWVDRLNLSASINASVTNKTFASLPLFEFRMDRAGRQIAAINANGQFDLKKKSGGLGYALQADLAEASKLNAVPGMRVAVGLLDIRGLVQQSEQQEAKITGKISLPGFSGGFDKTQFQGLAMDVDLAATLVSNKVATLERLNGTLTHGGQPAGGFEISGAHNLTSGGSSATMKLQAVNQNLLRPAVEPLLMGMQLAKANINASLVAEGQPGVGSKVSGTLNVSDLVILDQSGAIPALPLGLNAKLDAQVTGEGDATVISIPGMTGELMRSGQQGGQFTLAANFNAKEQAGDFHLAVNALDERFIAPLANASLKPISLRSILVNMGASGKLNFKSASTVNAMVNVDRVVVFDPSGAIPSTPLNLKIGLDSEMDKKLFKLKHLVLNLAPTSRAANELKLSGDIDLTETNATSANLTLSSAGLDMTHYYNIMENREKEPATEAPAPPPAQTENKEPDSVTLPIKDTSIEVDIAKFYLRKIEATSIKATAKVDRHLVKADPVSLNLNGAPVTAYLDVDLSQPGFVYDVRFSANQVPVSPLIGSFSPAVGNRTKGDLVANVNVKGRGTTGVNLQKHLNGNVGFYLTNAAVYVKDQTVQPKPVQFGLLSGLAGFGKAVAASGIAGIMSQLGVPDLSQTPITHIDTRVEMGTGKIQLKSADILSSAFKVKAAGDITIQPNLNDSPIAIPVDVWLNKNMMTRFKYTAVNGDFGRLPHFVDIGGTVGEYKVDTDYKVLLGATTGIAGELAGGVAGDVTKAAGNLIQGLGGKGKGLGGILGGNRTNKNNVGGLLGNLLGGQNKSGGQALTNAQPAKKQAPIGNVFNIFDGAGNKQKANSKTNAPTVKTNKPAVSSTTSSPG